MCVCGLKTGRENRPWCCVCNWYQSINLFVHFLKINRHFHNRLTHNFCILTTNYLKTSLWTLCTEQALERVTDVHEQTGLIRVRFTPHSTVRSSDNIWQGLVSTLLWEGWPPLFLSHVTETNQTCLIFALCHSGHWYFSFVSHQHVCTLLLPDCFSFLFY